MKVLMITRKVDKNDWLAGFAYFWVATLAKKIEVLKVISLEEGDKEGLPPNVEVSFVGKGNLSRFQRLLRFRSQVLRHEAEVDVVFAHMHPIYAILAKIFSPKRKIVLWYTHKKVDLKLRCATLLVDRIFSASPESFRLKTNKVRFLGHGIDTERFSPIVRSKKELFKILTVGRISPVKKVDLLIDSLGLLKEKYPHFKWEAEIIGSVGLASQKDYYDNLKKQAQNLTEIKFTGPIPNSQIADCYQNADLFINLSETGSVDKTVLEAAASGCLVLTSNEAFKSILPPRYTTLADKKGIAQKIHELSMFSEEQKQLAIQDLRQIVVQNHSLDSLFEKIVSEFKKL